MISFQLQEHKAQNDLRCSALRTKIQELWERLQIPHEEREALSEHMVISKKRNIEAVRNFMLSYMLFHHKPSITSCINAYFVFLAPD